MNQRRQKIRHTFPRAFCAAAALLFAAFCAGCAGAPDARAVPPTPLTSGALDAFEPAWRQVVPGVDLLAARVSRPRLRFWALRVDLAAPGVAVTLAPPEGAVAAAGTVASTRVSGFARAHNCLAAINAGPFWPVSGREGEAREITGVFVTDGMLVSGARAGYGALVFDAAGRAAVVSQSALPPLSAITNAAGGFYVVLAGSRVDEAAQKRPARHPRSAAGVSADGRVLYLLAIDGRQPASRGATEGETALILRSLGAADGLNFDGGGSTALALRLNGMVRVLNTPVHNRIPGRERAVATCVGIIGPSE